MGLTKEEVHQRLTSDYHKNIAEDLANEFFDIWSYLNFVLTTHGLWSPEGTYTFPDGQTLYAKDM